MSEFHTALNIDEHFLIAFGRTNRLLKLRSVCKSQISFVLDSIDDVISYDLVNHCFKPDLKLRKISKMEVDRCSQVSDIHPPLITGVQ